jgi:hypothetical protein
MQLTRAPEILEITSRLIYGDFGPGGAHCLYYKPLIQFCRTTIFPRLERDKMSLKINLIAQINNLMEL